jgi:hypothetical protein
MNKEPIWVATIEHKHGSNIYLATEESTLKKVLFEAYIKDSWEDFCDGPIPDDPEKAIEEYFSCAEAFESLTIEQGELFSEGELQRLILRT